MIRSKFYSKQKSAIPTKQAITISSRHTDFFHKMVFGMFIIVVMASLQLYAWHCNHNGIVFAFTSTIIGLTAGSVLGFEWGLKHGSN